LRAGGAAGILAPRDSGDDRGAMIETARLRLRPARIEDAGDLFAVFSDPRAMRYWDSLPHVEVAQTRRWLEGMVRAAPGTSADFVVERGGRAIGKAGCWRVGPSPWGAGVAGEIGFILHPDHWGQGIASEALAAAIPEVLRRLEVARLEADVDPRNAAALRLLGRFGFREVGRAENTVRLGEEWCDSVYLALERDGGVGA
jgi:RimJ/RimL family protein N-acetyltransferase